MVWCSLEVLRIVPVESGREGAESVAVLLTGIPQTCSPLLYRSSTQGPGLLLAGA